jgi:hypothetical protein
MHSVHKNSSERREAEVFAAEGLDWFKTLEILEQILHLHGLFEEIKEWRVEIET